ncbi:hypothetical protein K501DRAFT_302273 [Backusella circina FSU 941]|nr:hypothetical protein K501DRAFT_302273 [Backusella circina FSU 941]
MDRLPGEILHKIFIHLPIIQKQEFMLVCRQWKEVISTRSLFHTMNCSYTKSCVDFIEMIKKSPSIGAQVQNLKLHGDFEESDHLLSLIPPSLQLYPDTIIKQILSLFINLREIEFNSLCPSALEDHDFSKTYKIVPLPSKIQSICEYGTAIMTCSLAVSGLCSRLVSLRLHMMRFVSKTDPDVLCSLLRDMPILEYLEIWNQLVTPKHCEILHTNIPSLKSFSLHCIEHGGKDIVHENIEPLSSITNLLLQVSISKSKNISIWFRYIDKKYPNLQHFHFGNSYSTHGYEPEVLRQDWSSHLTSLDLTFIYFSSSLFHLLDRSGCKIKNLKLRGTTMELINALVRSKQRRYVEMLNIGMEYACSFEWLRKLKKLRDLSLGMDSQYRAKASSIFQFCPKTVESVDIKEYQVKFDIEAMPKSLSIKNLVLDHNNKDLRMVSFIADCFPYLESLSIRKIFNGSEIYEFPNHHFSYLNLDTYGFSGFNLAITTLNDNVTRLYHLPGQRSYVGQQKYENYIASVPRAKMADGNCIKLVCGSVKDVVFAHSYLSFIENNEILPI